jgi:hypothetical protein
MSDDAALVGEATSGVSSGSGEQLGHDGEVDLLAEADQGFSRVPPFVFPASLRPQGYEQGRYTETWRAVSNESCRDIARELLLQLRGSGMELVEAGYLDLFGEAWGCTLEDAGEASITIVLIPERPFSQRSTSNPLRMTLIRTTVPTQDVSG